MTYSVVIPPSPAKACAGMKVILFPEISLQEKRLEFPRMCFWNLSYSSPEKLGLEHVGMVVRVGHKEVSRHPQFGTQAGHCPIEGYMDENLQTCCAHTIDRKRQQQHRHKRETLVPVNESCKNS